MYIKSTAKLHILLKKIGLEKDASNKAVYWPGDSVTESVHI